MSKVTATPNRFSAALLKVDKTAFKHVATTKDSSQFLKIGVMKGTKAKGGVGTVLCLDSIGEKSSRSYYVNADTARTEYIIFRLSFVAYGKGTLQHPVFDRSMYAEDVIPFYVALNNLDGEIYVMIQGSKSGTYVHSTILTDVYGKDANKYLEIIRTKLTALQNSLKTGGNNVVYDERLTVRQGDRTAYGQYIDDNGKRQDESLKAWHSRNGYQSIKATDPVPALATDATAAV